MLRALIGEQTWSSPGHARLEISRFHNTTRAPSSSPGTPPSSSLIHPHQLFILPLCRAQKLAFASRKKIPLIHETKKGRKAKGGQDPGMVARKALAGESRPSHRARQRTRRQRRQQRPDRVGENSRRDGQKKTRGSQCCTNGEDEPRRASAEGDIPRAEPRAKSRGTVYRMTVTAARRRRLRVATVARAARRARKVSWGKNSYSKTAVERARALMPSWRQPSWRRASRP